MIIKDKRKMSYELLQGDCLELMKDIPDGSVDMILCDPPYGTTACKWDTIISFETMWELYERIIKNNGAICLFGCEPFSSKLRLSNLDMYKYDWYWKKSRVSGFTNAKLKPLKDVETISVFSKGKTSNGNSNNMVYFPQGLIEINKTVTSYKRNEADKEGHKFDRPSHRGTYVQQFTNYPKQLLEFSSESKTQHPTQKPVALLEYLIKTYTNEGDVVLDNCMGSGSTGVACVNTNRNFIGIELNEEYFNIAKERIEGIVNSEENDSTDDTDNTDGTDNTNKDEDEKINEQNERT